MCALRPAGIRGHDFISVARYVLGFERYKMRMVLDHGKGKTMKMHRLSRAAVLVALGVADGRPGGNTVAAAPVSSEPRGTSSPYRTNPAYFEDARGTPVVFIGDYTWGTFSDVDCDFTALFDTLGCSGLNFSRVWVWWGSEVFPEPIDRLHVEPYVRAGPGTANDGKPRYDLTQFNPAFFDRLQAMCAAARERGIFLQLTLFDAWMIKHRHLWRLHAYCRDNNINGVDADPANRGTGDDGKRGFCSMGNPKVLEAQKAFVAKVVDTVNAFDHIFFEIANENYYSAEWELHLCEFIHDYEKDKPRQHLAMPLDLPNHDYGGLKTYDIAKLRKNLLAARPLRRPLISDTDGIGCPDDATVRRAAWTVFVSGGHLDYLDDSLQIGAEYHGDLGGSRRATLRKQLANLAAFTRQVRFWEMPPDESVIQAGHAFAMASESELVAYLPRGGSVTLDLAKIQGALEARWYNVVDGTWSAPSDAQGGGQGTFTAPGTDDWVLYIRNYSDTEAPSTPTNVRATAQTATSVRLTWTASSGDHGGGVAGYKIFRDGAQVATSVAPGYTDYGLQTGRTYSYALSAFDLSGNEAVRPSPPVQVTTPGRPEFCSVDLGATDVTDLLRHVTDRDGHTAAVTVHDTDCRQPAGAKDAYFYFAIDDMYMYNEAGITVYLEVSYFDGAGYIEPQYDSTAGAYTNVERINLAGTDRWTTATWTLTRCRFANRQNAGADFRLEVGENSVKIDKIKVSCVAPR